MGAVSWRKGGVARTDVREKVAFAGGSGQRVFGDQATRFWDRRFSAHPDKRRGTNIAEVEGRQQHRPRRNRDASLEDVLRRFGFSIRVGSALCGVDREMAQNLARTLGGSFV